MHYKEARHENYIMFRARCPSCYQVALARIDYGNMCGCLYTKWRQENPYAPPVPLEQYCQELMKGLDGTFGGVRRPVELDTNCLGWPEEIQGYMRTRLVSPTFKASVWRLLHNVPSAAATAECYKQNAKAYYRCVPCGDSGGLHA